MITTPYTMRDLIDNALLQANMTRAEFDYSLASGDGKAQAWIFQSLRPLTLKLIYNNTATQLIDEHRIAQHMSNIWAELYPHITRLTEEARHKKYKIITQGKRVRVHYVPSY